MNGEHEGRRRRIVAWALGLIARLGFLAPGSLVLVALAFDPYPGRAVFLLGFPDAGVGVIAFTNRAMDPSLWLPGKMSTILRQLAGLPPDGIRSDVPHRPDVWGDLVGWYRLDAGLSDIRVRA